jgi:transcription factor TGA
MGDTSPRTSVSTDGDTDHNNLMFDEGHLGIGASDSSDRSKSKMDQKVNINISILQEFGFCH